MSESASDISSAAQESPRSEVSPLFDILMGSLDRAQGRAVLDAIARHEAEVRAADAAGERAVEAR